MSDFEAKKSILFMKMLNNKGSRIDLCGIPQITEVGTNFCPLFPITEVIP